MSLFSPSPRAAAIDALHAATAIYTAEHVVDQLLSRLDWPRADRRLLDPSCGDGAFLGLALARLLRARPDVRMNELLDLIEGWEIHPFAADQARHRLRRQLLEHGWRAEDAGNARDLIRNADFLTAGPTGRDYHAIAGNPPYLRFANVPAALRDEYEASLPDHARADLLHSFLDRCADLVADDGEIALVTADRWLFNMNAAALRAVLGRRLGLGHIERLDAATAFYRPKLRRAGTPPRIHPVAIILRQQSDKTIVLGRDAIYPDAPRDQGIAARTLADVAQVRLAPWLGTPGIFVVDEATARSFPADQLVPAIDTDDFAGGTLRVPRRFAIRTIADCEPCAAILTHIRSQLHRMATRGLRSPEWLPPEAWQGIPLDRPSLLVPRIAKTLRPVRIPAGVLPINHNLHIVSAGAASLDEIESELREPAAQAWAEAHAPRLENGYRSITTTLLRRLPVNL